MSSVIIKNVTDKKGLKTFIEFHYDLYKKCPFDVPNLYSDELNTLSKDKNAAFDFCESEYFLAYRDGKLVGRVAAIINHRANEAWNRKAVRFGWIDFVDDMEVSTALLKAVENWGKSKGMNMIQGPLGFTDMDPEGMLTFGFNEMGTMATSYNYDYYPKHLEQMSGFVKDNDYVEYYVPVPKEMPERLTKLAQMIMKRYNLRIKKLKKEDIYKNGYGHKVFDIINETFSHLYGYSRMTERQIDQYVDMYFPFADLDFITLIEDASCDNKLVGVGITLPSLSMALQKCKNGRLFPFGWYYVLRALKFHKTKAVDLLLIGVLPEYRAKGANSLIFYDLIPRYQKYGIEGGETHVEMETNFKVQSQWQDFQPRLHKRRRCYKKDI
jgi:GNAT superfamily N-acetyltransferase